jgi:hypothetical protein
MTGSAAQAGHYNLKFKDAVMTHLTLEWERLSVVPGTTPYKCAKEQGTTGQDLTPCWRNASW